MKKHCPEHGDIDSVVELDTDFYYSLRYTKYSGDQALLTEVTDRCQLECPHCYHLPDNKTIDQSVDYIVEKIKQLPSDCWPHLAGAEPTLHKDFVNIVEQIKNLDFESFCTLTNGVKFADREFAQKSFDAGLKVALLGLNHHSYQGKKIHQKQLKGLKNMLDIGYTIRYVGYTLESLEHLPDVLMEISKIHHPNIKHFRIRCGSFIGRSVDKKRSYLSGLVAQVQKILKSSVSIDNADNNPYHVMMNWNKTSSANHSNIRLRLIQWPDVSNIDLEELTCGPWANFNNGPVTNFVHQVITRDAHINMKLPQLDLAPIKYQYLQHPPYWKDQWSGPVPFDTFQFEWPSDRPQPVKSYFPIQSQR
jgi:uncharacterized Fe-S cluster-containing radical SAM superfamily protein